MKTWITVKDMTEKIPISRKVSQSHDVKYDIM